LAAPVLCKRTCGGEKRSRDLQIADLNFVSSFLRNRAIRSAILTIADSQYRNLRRRNDRQTTAALILVRAHGDGATATERLLQSSGYSKS
jgi:hypothetical protein